MSLGLILVRVICMMKVLLKVVIFIKTVFWRFKIMKMEKIKQLCNFKEINGDFYLVDFFCKFFLSNQII